MPNQLPVLQGYWRLLEPKETAEFGDEYWNSPYWLKVGGNMVGHLQLSLVVPIRRRVSPPPTCGTCPHWKHTYTSSGPTAGMFCKLGLGPGKMLPQDGSGWCCLHQKAQEVTR